MKARPSTEGTTRESARAQAELARLEREAEPSTSDVKLLAARCIDWSRAGFAAEGKRIAARWLARAPKSRPLRFAHAAFTLYASPNATGVLGAVEPSVATAALEATACVVRGDHARALTLARAHGFFLSRADLSEAFINVIWALHEQGETDRARELVGEWRARHPNPKPSDLSPVLRTDAWLATHAFAYRQAIDSLRQARELAEAAGMDVELSLVEASLVRACALDERFAEAQAVVDGWTVPGGSPRSEVEGYQALARMDLAHLAEDADRAYAMAVATATYFEQVDNAMLAAHARFVATLSAPPERARAELAGYRRAARRTRGTSHDDRVELLERLIERDGIESFRDVRCVERAASSTERVPLIRLWSPRGATGESDLLVDAVHRRVRLFGAGPHALDDHPTLGAVLEALVTGPRDGFDLAALHHAVWGGSYHPLRHETKVHVTLHRLRAWLRARSPGAGSFVEVRNGRARLARGLDARHVGLEPDVRLEPPDVCERVLRTLEDRQAHSPAELERRLGISRSSLNGALRALVAQRRAVVEGEGPSTTYRAAS